MKSPSSEWISFPIFFINLPKIRGKSPWCPFETYHMYVCEPASQLLIIMVFWCFTEMSGNVIKFYYFAKYMYHGNLHFCKYSFLINLRKYTKWITTEKLMHIQFVLHRMGRGIIDSAFNWAMSWQNLLLPYANNKGAGQPVHLSIEQLILNWPQWTP